MKNDVGKNPQSAPVKINLVVDGGKNPTIRPRAISLSGPQQAQACCNLPCFRELYQANITMMGKPNSGIARGELRSTLSRAGSCRSSATTTMTDDDGGRKARSAHVACDGAGQQWGPNGEAGAEMNETAPKGTASFYVSAVRRLPCYVINYFLAALAAFLFSFHTYASYIIGVPMKMEA